MDMYQPSSSLLNFRFKYLVSFGNVKSVYYNSQNVLHSTNAAKYTLLRLQS